MAKKTFERDMTAEQQNLANSLMSQAEGGARTDTTVPLSDDPATQGLLQEQVNMRTYGTATPQFRDSVAPGGQQAPQGMQTPSQQAGVVQADPLYDRIAALYPEREMLSEDELARKEMERIQNQIDAINQLYAGRIAEENLRGEGRLGQTRAVNALSGTLYDPFGQARQSETEAYNREVVGAIQAERANLIASLTNEAAARAQQRFRESTEDAMRRADALTSAIVTTYQLNQQEARALRQEALQRAQMTGELDGEQTLDFRNYLLDVTSQLESSQRADEQLELQRQQFERSGYETQVMPDGRLIAIDYRSFPPTTTVIGNYARPVASGGGTRVSRDGGLDPIQQAALREYIGAGYDPRMVSGSNIDWITAAYESATGNASRETPVFPRKTFVNEQMDAGMSFEADPFAGV